MKNTKKTYLEINSPFIYREKGWTKEEADMIVDKLIELIDEFDADCQVSLGYVRHTEDQMAKILNEDELEENYSTNGVF